jgi:hypothetical protein
MTSRIFWLAPDFNFFLFQIVLSIEIFVQRFTHIFML